MQLKKSHLKKNNADSIFKNGHVIIGVTLEQTNSYQKAVTAKHLPEDILHSF